MSFKRMNIVFQKGKNLSQNRIKAAYQILKHKMKSNFHMKNQLLLLEMKIKSTIQNHLIKNINKNRN